MKEKVIPYAKVGIFYAAAVALFTSFIAFSNGATDANQPYVSYGPVTYMEEPTKQYFYGQEQIQAELSTKLQFEPQ